MKLQNKGKYFSIPAATVATNATAALSIDTKGFDYANVVLNMGTCATTSAAFSTLKFSESDTLTTPASMTDIVALTGATATSTSAGFVIPTQATMTTGGNAIEFQIDLRNRKRYLGFQATPGQSLVFGVTARCTEDEQSKDSASAKSGVNNSASTVIGLSQIVTV